MLKSINKQFLLVYVINIVIAIAYYVDNLETYYSELSSDIQNIIPVAQKFDDPELFKYDLFVNDIDNVRYYTPFYVQPLRFIAKFTNYDYVQAINVLGLICHLLFGILWFYLIYKFINHFWIALFLSIIIRGIVWLPGLEIWGISDLWTIMPRTVYITLMPIPFLFLTNKLNKLFISSFLIGLVFNFHPITGLGGILLYLSFLILSAIYFNYKNLINVKNIALMLFFLCIGMLPFMLTYFGKTSSSITYDINEFNAAFNNRIASFFSEPLNFLKLWLRFKTLFFAIPLLLYLWVSRKNNIEFKKAKLLIILSMVLVIIPTLSVPIERFLNSVMGLNLRLSFQLIRMQKVAILPGVFAIGLLLNHVMINHKKINKYMPHFVALYVIMLVFNKNQLFNSVPFMGDDISRFILPNNLSAFSGFGNEKRSSDHMAEYITKNTPKDALLFANFFYRGASKRSVILDGKGASMVIEGNPARLIQWNRQKQTYLSLNTDAERITYLKSLGVDYIVSRTPIPNLQKRHQVGTEILYKIK